MNTYKRLDLSNEEMEQLLHIVKRYEEQGNSVPVLKPKVIEVSSKKSMSAMSATDSKKKKSVKRIKMAIEYIEQENKKMTYTAIAKYAGISPITVKKYVSSITGNKPITTSEYYYLSK